MADSEETKDTLLSQETNKVEDKLTPTNFAKQELTALGLQFGGAAIGALAGAGLQKAGVGKNFSTTSVSTSRKPLNIGVLPLIGGVAGFIIGGIAAGFRHWQRTEGERLAVDEINKDVSSVMASRVQFENTLEQQGQVIRALREEIEATRGNASKTTTELKKREAASLQESVIGR